MAEQNPGFQFEDEASHRTFIIPVDPSVFDGYSPTVQSRIIDYFVNSTLQGEQLNKGLYSKNKNNAFAQPPIPATPAVQASPFGTNPNPIGPPQSATGAASESAPFRFAEQAITPFANNVAGAALGAMSPIDTLSSIPSNTKQSVQQQATKAKQLGAGPVETAGRRLGASLSPLIGPGAVQAGESFEGGDVASGLGRTVGEVGAAMLPFGMGKAGRNAENVANDFRGGTPTFSRTIGDPRNPELNVNVPQTMPEAMQAEHGASTVGNAVQGAIGDTAVMNRFNSDRIENMTRDLRQLPVKVTPPAGATSNLDTVRNQTKVGRIPKGQPGAGRMQKQSAITSDTYALLGQQPGEESAAALQQLPREAINNIVSDVHSGVVPQDVMKAYFVDMMNRIVEDAIPSSKLTIDPASRRSGEIANISGSDLMRKLEGLSQGTYQSAGGHSVQWNRLQVLADAAGVDSRVMTDNLSAVASQLEHLQATGKLGPKIDRINLAMSVPIKPQASGSSRIFGASPMVAGAGGGAGVGASVGAAVGGLPGAGIGALVGGAAGSSLPSVIAWAAVSPRAMFALRQFLRMSGTAASEFAAAKRLQDTVASERDKLLSTSTSGSQKEGK